MMSLIHPSQLGPVIIDPAADQVAEKLHRALELRVGITTVADELVHHASEALTGLQRLQEAVAAYERTVTPHGGQPAPAC